MSERKIRNRAVLIAILLSLAVGLGVSSKLYMMDMELWGGTRETPSFCNVSEFVNCDAVSMSEYSIFWGLPNAGWGIVIYSIGLIILLVALFSREKIYNHLLRAEFILFFILFLSNLYLLYICVAVIKAICVLCIATYLINFMLILAFSYMLKESLPRIFRNYILDVRAFIAGLFGKAQPDRKMSLKVIGILAVVLSLAVFGVFYLGHLFRQSTRTSGFDFSSFLNEVYLKFPQRDVFLSETSPAWGKVGAKLKIVEFSDFKCPYCRKAAFVLNNLLSQHKNSLELVFRNFPLDASCNPLISGSLHPGACMLAKASICAEKSEKFWEFNNWLFNSSLTVSRSGIVEMAAKLGMKSEEFESCLESDETRKILAMELLDAKRLNVDVTPTFFINGREVKGLLSPIVFEKVLRYELERK